MRQEVSNLLELETRKAVRQKLMQTAVLEKIERNHLRMDTPAIRELLTLTRKRVQGTAMIDRVKRWERIVRTGDLESVRRIVESDDEDSLEMRNLSPLSVLLEENERRDVIRATRRRFER